MVCLRLSHVQYSAHVPPAAVAWHHHVALVLVSGPGRPGGGGGYAYRVARMNIASRDGQKHGFRARGSWLARAEMHDRKFKTQTRLVRR